MDPLYILRPASAPPEVPPRWSFTTLAEWRSCPRRWALRHARYPNVRTKTYPERYGKALLQGRLVHDALEQFLASRREPDAGIPFSLRKALRARLHTILTEEAASNPRLDTAGLYGAVSLDECAARFLALVERMDLPPIARGPRPRTHVGSRPSVPPTEAEELPIDRKEPPVWGRIDRVQGGILIDFKTGEPDDAHPEQLRFYALLWWLQYRTVPRGLRLVYTGRSEPIDIPVPSPEELRREATAIQAEIAAAKAALQTPEVPAKASVDTCRFCPVRHLCREYWQSGATAPLRSLPDGDAGYADIRLSKLPAGWIPGQAMAGSATAEFGSHSLAVRVFIDRSRCPSDKLLPLAARILGTRVERTGDTFSVKVTPTSEVFWELGST